jgi:hypothetical protein
LHANAGSIYSTICGGGANGHLALIMPAVDYLAWGFVPFVAPLHPVATPTHVDGATATQITNKTNHLFKQTIEGSEGAFIWVWRNSVVKGT